MRSNVGAVQIYEFFFHRLHRKAVELMSSLRHPEYLETQAIHIIREVVGEADHPVMLYPIGKTGSVVLRLGAKEFFPGKRPYSLLHVDTIWKFREIVLFRECMAVELGHGFLVRVNQEGLAMNIGPIDHGSVVQTDRSERRRRVMLQPGNFLSGTVE